MRAIIYGLGTNYKLHKDFICERYEVVGVSDINEQYAQMHKGFILKSELVNRDESIVVTCAKYEPIVNEFVNLGIPPEKIILLEEILLAERYGNTGAFIAYSQFGEDYVIQCELEKKSISLEEARYIEVGVDHPFIANTTYFLQKNGAHGILVEANPDRVSLIRTCRKKQTIVNAAIYENSGEQVPFYIANIPALSSMDKENIQLNGGTIIREIVIDTISMNDLFEMQSNTVVCSIDLEGYDEIALRAIDFLKYHPEIVIAEIGTPDYDLLSYMDHQGYKMIFNNRINTIWSKR